MNRKKLKHHLDIMLMMSFQKIMIVLNCFIVLLPTQVHEYTMQRDRIYAIVVCREETAAQVGWEGGDVTAIMLH